MNKTTRWISVAAAVLALTGCSAPAVSAPTDQPVAVVSVGGIPVEVERGGRAAAAVLDDSPAGRAFTGSLPVTVEVDDSFGLALVGRLPDRPAASGQTASTEFVLGEIAYAPDAESVVVFHDNRTDRVASPGVVRLGVVTDGLEAVATADGPVTIRLPG